MSSTCESSIEMNGNKDKHESRASTHFDELTLMNGSKLHEEKSQAGILASESLCSSAISVALPSVSLRAKFPIQTLAVNQSENIPADVDRELSRISERSENVELQGTNEAPTKRPEPANVNIKSDLAYSPLLKKSPCRLESHDHQDNVLKHNTPAAPLDGRSRASENDCFAQPSAPDGGWGWAVLIGAFYIVAFMINITICFGILFSSRMRDLRISSGEASYVFMLHNVMYNFGILLTNTMVVKFGFRKVSFVGCLVASLSFMTLAFANSLTFIVIVYSIIVPISAGLGSTVSFLIVPLYFEKRRGLAMAIMMTGIAAGGIVCPLLIRFLQDNYGFFWATLIQGAVILNCCVAAALFRPLPAKKRIRCSSFELKVNSLDEINEKELANATSSSGRVSALSALLENISTFTQPLTVWMKQNYIVLKKRKVLMIGFSLSTAMVGYFNFLMLVPFAVESTGHTPQFAAQCVSVSNFSNAGMRLLVSAVADRSWLNRNFCFGMGVFIATLTSLAFVFVTHSEAWMTCSMVVFGLGIGLYMSLYHVHMIDVLGMELFSSAVGVNAIIMAFTFALSGPLFGGIRRLSTSYGCSLGACSSLLFCSTLLVVKLHTGAAGCKRFSS